MGQRDMDIQLVLAIKSFPTMRATVQEHIWEVNGLQMILAMDFLSMNLATERAHELFLVSSFI